MRLFIGLEGEYLTDLVEMAERCEDMLTCMAQGICDPSTELRMKAQRSRISAARLDHLAARLDYEEKPSDYLLRVVVRSMNTLADAIAEEAEFAYTNQLAYDDA